MLPEERDAAYIWDMLDSAAANLAFQCRLKTI